MFTSPKGLRYAELQSLVWVLCLMSNGLEGVLWEVVKPLLAIGVLVFLYTFTRSLFPSSSPTSSLTDAQSTEGQPSTMVYRGVPYGRLPDPDEVERSPHEPDTTADDSQTAETTASQPSQPEMPNSVVRLTYRGVPYIRLR